MSLASFVQHILVPSGLVSFSITCFLGVFVYLKNRQSDLNRFFAIFALSVGCWSIGSSLENMIANEALALRILRLCYIFASFLPTFFLHFSLVLAQKLDAGRRYLRWSYFVSVIFALLTLTNIFIQKLRVIEPYGFRISAPGPAYRVFFIFFTVCLGAGLWLMYRRAQTTTGNQQRQAQYIFLSHLIAFAAGIEYFSRVFRLIEFPPVDDYILVLYFLVFAYAIVRHRLLDIHVVVRRSVVYSRPKEPRPLGRG